MYFLFGAVDGAFDIFFDIHLTGKGTNGSFFGVLQHTLFFWAFLKAMELGGAISLLFNYKPALGVALLAPISSVLCLFYVFGLHWYIQCLVLIALNLILLRAYWDSYKPLFTDAYPIFRPDLPEHSNLNRRARHD